MYPAQRPLPYTKNPFRVTGWQGSLRLFFKGLCTEYKSSSFTGLSHKLAPDPKIVTQNGGSLWQWPSIQASPVERPDPQLVVPQEVGPQHLLSEAEPFQSGVLQKNSFK